MPSTYARVTLETYTKMQPIGDNFDMRKVIEEVNKNKLKANFSFNIEADPSAIQQISHTAISQGEHLPTTKPSKSGR